MDVDVGMDVDMDVDMDDVGMDVDMHCGYGVREATREPWGALNGGERGEPGCQTRGSTVAADPAVRHVQHETSRAGSQGARGS